jgi:hypothetical protein
MAQSADNHYPLKNLSQNTRKMPVFSAYRLTETDGTGSMALTLRKGWLKIVV